MDNPESAAIPSKRSRSRIEVSRETHAYPRKRALKACNTCRLRKTKCNNERPICGFCQTLGAGLDPASQRVMDRLDQVLRKLDLNEEQSSQNFSQILRKLDQAQPHHGRRPDTIGVDPALDSASASQQDTDGDLTMDENMMTPDGRTSPDAVIDWPVFKNQYPLGFITDSLFVHAYASLTPTSTSDELSSPSINEESVPRLVEVFLCRVHTKNPVLDIETARRYANAVAQHGLRWNGPSCLTLIMCALGCTARPFSDLYSQSLSQDQNLSSRRLHGASLAMGRAYYDAACKRIGLLEASILSSQCIFLCGVYEMYNLNPLKAWRWFSNSSSTLYTYLRCQDVYIRDDDSAVSCSTTQRLEASIYWSSYKSMCELRTELPMPASLLAEVKYPHVLPTPPTRLQSTADSFSNQEVEMSSDKMQEQAWFNTLPAPIQFDDHDIRPSNELQFTVQFRALEIKSWLYRPFLYYTIHHVPYTSLSPRLQALVIKAVDTSIHWILLRPVRHRHQGTWYVGRLVLSSALSLLAAVKSGLEDHVRKLGEWRNIVKEAISALEFWEDESPDFSKGREVITVLYNELDEESSPSV
ncbi:hypothetical protein BKA64DRAFT_758445 [Cadophora sp. MPI-SDFR-AT-0126]|nr:hypothetical protein BKA64DRAFT_758445 [Leotiomycetes sp. MPI-SDFR-AT-0126]